MRFIEVRLPAVTATTRVRAEVARTSERVRRAERGYPSGSVVRSGRTRRRLRRKAPPERASSMARVIRSNSATKESLDESRRPGRAEWRARQFAYDSHDAFAR